MCIDECFQYPLYLVSASKFLALLYGVIAHFSDVVCNLPLTHFPQLPWRRITSTMC